MPGFVFSERKSRICSALRDEAYFAHQGVHRSRQIDLHQSGEQQQAVARRRHSAMSISASSCVVLKHSYVQPIPRTHFEVVQNQPNERIAREIALVATLLDPFFARHGRRLLGHFDRWRFGREGFVVYGRASIRFGVFSCGCGVLL